jgi:hypothetical protein
MLKKSNKLLNIYVAFIIILASLALVLFFSVPEQIKKHIEKHPEPIQNEEQPKDETADWLVYENEKYRYRVKYPKDWFYEIRSINEDSQRMVIFDYKRNDKKYIKITVDPNKTLEELSKELSSLIIYNAPPITQKKIKFHGLDAIYSTGDFLGYSEYIFFERNKTLYRIEYYIGNVRDKNDYELNIFNKMMRSFEFIK